MQYCDYHLHTEFSFDSREKMDAVCQKAVEEGIREICFTEHVEFAAEDAREWPDFAKRQLELEKCRSLYGDRLTILSGIESGQPYREPEKERELFAKQEFDFVIGSVHIVGNTGRPSKFPFQENNYLEYFRQYFTESKLLAEKCEFDVMGHVTFPFRYVPEALLEAYPIEGFRKEYMELFDLLASKGRGIEINTSGLRTSLKSTMPNVQIVKWFRECGGQIVTVGSDGHSARSACSGIVEGYRVLQEAGFDKVALYRNRQVQLVKL